MKREGGQEERICLAETKFSDGASLDVVADFKNDVTVEWPGKNILSPIIVLQCCLNSGSGTVKSIILNL